MTLDQLGAAHRAATPKADARALFIRRVVEAFDKAGVEYVLLHAADRRTIRDSDLDIAVTRRSLLAVDTLVRAGTFGRMLQRFDYDVPWCYTYVVEATEPDRRYREIDIACDPWGIGRYGPAVPIALDSMQSSAGFALDGGAECAYLAIKRAFKGLRSEDERTVLAAAVGKHGESAAALLERRMGGGAGLALMSLREGKALEEGLGKLAADVRRYRRKPSRLLRRTVFQAIRGFRRIRHPTGLVVALVGPDGVGKSTLASGLEVEASNVFRRVDRRHLGPGLLPPPARLLGRRPTDGSEPHSRTPSGYVGTAARLAYLWVDALLGWSPRIALPRARSSLVILERGWYDLAVDPERYRLSFGSTLVRLLGTLLPRPDLVLLLDARPDAVFARKRELEPEEVERQLRAWQTLAPRAGRRTQRLDASAPREHLLEEALEVIERELESRTPELALAQLPVRAAGCVARSGRSLALVRMHGKPRWLVDRRFGARGPLRAGLYRPARARQLPGALALEGLAAAGRLGTPIPLDLDRGLLPVLSRALGRRDLSLGGIGLSRDREQRAFLTLRAEGRLVGFAKLSPAAEPLAYEQLILEALERANPETFAVPSPLALIAWEGLTVLVLEAIVPRGRAARPMGQQELAVLEELSGLATLEPVLGSADGLVPIHGDFAPWNTGRTRAGGYVVWDWEDARLGLPFEDFFHWNFQLLTLFGFGSVEEIVRSATVPAAQIAGLCRRLGVDAGAPARALRAYLQQRLSQARTGSTTDEMLLRGLSLLARETE